MLKRLSIFFFLILFLYPNLLLADKDDFYLSAQNIYKDDKNSFINAKGNVQIRKGKIYLKSDYLEYKIEKKEIIARGNVQILSDTGEVVFAESAILNEELKNGIIKNLGMLLSDGSRLASKEALSTEDNNKTVYKKTIFTKCKDCNEGKNVLWQIKARKASHLKKRNIIVYEGVTLEAFGLPVAYIPFFYHPDPSVKSKTGLLTPKFSSSNVFGYTYEQPLYVRLEDSSDILFKPKVTSKEGIILAKDYRKKFKTGELKFNSSVTRGSKVRENEPTKKEIRGHVDFEYANKNDNDWLLGANIKRASDKSYLARYRLSDGESVLTQNIFLEKEGLSNGLLLEAYRFQTLSDNFSSTNLPFIRPLIKYRWNNYKNKNRNRINQTQVVLRSITNKKNEDSNSLHWNSSSEKKYLYNGLLIKDSLKINLDYYNTKNINSNNEDVLRFLPEMGLQFQYPLINSSNNSSIFEPTIQILFSDKDDKNNDVKNNDSKAVELTISNLFEENKYSGYDRLEDGFRVNYGFTYTAKNSNRTLYSNLGRTFHLDKQELFNYTNGFGKHNSDFVGNIELENKNSISFYYDFRISDEYELNKNRFKTAFNIGKTRLDFQYSQIRNFSSSNNSDTEQINYSTATNIFKNWSLYFSQYRDLAGAKYSSPLKTAFGIEFKNICTLLRINLTKDKSNDIDVPASTNLAFEIELF